MTTFNWSALTNGQTVTFNAASDILNFDDATITASSFSNFSFTSSNSGNFSLTFSGKTVTLTMPFASITTTNVTFADGSRFFVGDNTTAVGNGTINDDAANTLTGTTHDDAFFGLGGSDTLNGGDGNDIFHAAFNTTAFGNDTINGGNGFDTVAFSSNSTNAVTVNLATHSAGNGLQGTFTLSSIETAFGTAAADTFIGGDTVNASNADPLGNTNTERFRGNGGNDTITGGADFFTGGKRAVYFTVIDYANNDNTQAVSVNLSTGSASDGRGGTDSFTNIDGVRGGAASDTLTGGSLSRAQNGIFFELFRGNAGNDVIDGNNSGTDGNDASSDRADYSNNTSAQAIVVNMTGFLSGTVQDGLGGTDTLTSIDQVYGGAGNDTFNAAAAGGVAFDGGAGNDNFIGGTGRDAVRYQQSTSGVIVNLSASSITVNSVTVAAGTAKDGFGGTDTLTSIEDVRGSDFDDYLRGSDDTNVVEIFRGHGGNDTIDGGAGVDYVSYGQIALSLGGISVTLANGSASVSDGQGGTDTLINIEGIGGTNANDTLTGGAGTQWFRGNGGSDIINGGADNDWVSYVGSPSAVNVNLTTGQATDGYNGIAGLLALGGTDTLTSIENVEGSSYNDTITDKAGVANVLAGGLGNDVYTISDATDQVIENVGEGTDTVLTALGGYTLAANVETLTYTGVSNFSGTGNALANTITGGAQADAIDGGAGNDTMSGGTGGDLYYVQDSGDVITEGAGAGSDSVISYVTFTLPANVENIYTLAGGGATGNGDGNLLFGTYAATGQTLNGAGGNDIIYGTTLADVLIGGTGSDAIHGQGGNDTMAGGADDDAYYVDNACVTMENSAEGTDTVYASVNVTLSANVEILIPYGGATSGTGNGGNNVLFGNNGTAALTLDGAGGDDTIYGSNFGDTMTGGDGNDFMWGFLGNDSMAGGIGNDVYIVEQAGDQVTEGAAAGTDTVYASLSYTLTANVENLFIYGAATAGTGNGDANAVINYGIATGVTLDGAGGNDVVQGGAGNDTIIGGAGLDTLTGLGGNDTFTFNIGEAGGDTITDFAGNGAAAGDQIRLLGYGAGATFTQIDGTHWQVNYGPGLATHEIITFSNGASVHASDVLFV